jgi:hypothetical protein
MRKRRWFLAVTVCAVAASATFHAAAQQASMVTVEKVVGSDQALLRTNDSRTFLVEYGVGCLSLSLMEGRRVVVESTEVLFGIGGKIVIPKRSQACRISTATGVAQPPPALPRQVSEDVAPKRSVFTAALVASSFFSKAGLHKLPATELALLEEWILVLLEKRSAAELTRRTATPGALTLDRSINDSQSMIGGKRFQAQTMCFDMRQGDAVVATVGSVCACVQLDLLNLRNGKACKVWCK